MKIFKATNVFDEALERVRYLFDEFDDVGVWFSGGKDSTVTLEIALRVAEEKNRLPIPVIFVDQEAEWRAVIDYTRGVMNDPRVEPYWIQVPIKLFNATSMDEAWLNCWAEGEVWMRDKEKNSIHTNEYGTDRFYGIFPRILKHHWKGKRIAVLGGVRAEESPNRASGLTTGQTYKHVTWGKVENAKLEHYTFYPLYDWSYRDIWKAIHANQWRYCTVYNEYYRFGIQPIKMRVSNLHHETAVDQLFYLHEIEGDTWNALTKRLKGINQTKHMSKQEMFAAKELPFMFRDWAEYRDYLVDNLVQTDERRAIFRRKFADMDKAYEGMANEHERFKSEILCILANDFEFTKLDNFTSRPESINFRKHKKGQPINWGRPERDLRFIKPEERGVHG